MAKDAKTIREELARPFAPEDLEWRIQVTSKDKTSGLAMSSICLYAAIGSDCCI